MPTIDNLKKQIQAEVSRVLLSYDENDPTTTDIDKVLDEHLEEEGFHIMTREEEEEYWKSQGREEGADPFENEAALIWGDGEDREHSIEIIPDNMEDDHRYYFNWNGKRMYVQKKSIGTDKFEIGVFQDDTEENDRA